MKASRSYLVYIGGVALACFVLILFMVVSQMKRLAARKPIPVEHKLAELTEGLAQASFIAPEGELFHFVIGVKESVDRVRIGGRVSLLQGGDLVYQRVFSAEDVEPCNWLDAARLKGYIITWRGDSNELDSVLQPGKVYEVHIWLDDRPAQPASLWLTYLQAFETYRRTNRTN